MEFSYRLQRSPDAVLNKVCALAQDKVVVSGSNAKGQFTGMFEGTYSVDGEQASITIHHKPIFVSWEVVNQGLKYLVAE